VLRNLAVALVVVAVGQLPMCALLNRTPRLGRATMCAATKDANVLWQAPGEVDKLDLANGPKGPLGRPQPPFQFVDENLAGSTPKIRVVDARRVGWMVKFGEEIGPRVFASKLAWVLGYGALPSYFVANGRVDGVGALKRAKAHVKPDGRFTRAAFELYVGSPVQWRGNQQSWSWTSNPFVGSKELNGLKVLVMLLADWDNKDARDVKRGSNTAILVYPDGEKRYLVVDWGGAMGTVGGYLSRSKWNCGGYRRQTRRFVRMNGDEIQWGYSGQHTKDFLTDIRVDDVRWLLTYLGRISDAQLRAGLLSSGATTAGAGCFATAIRTRIDELQSIVNTADDRLHRLNPASTSPSRR
jgi:hypothetical protein